MRKTVLYLLALGLIAGLLCVPVSAEEGWKFCIIERIVGLEHTTINGAPDNNSPQYYDNSMDMVVVADDIDSVTVAFNPVVGRTTPLTITKSYIEALNSWAANNSHRGGIPALWAWGGIDTYEVDAGWLDIEPQTVDTLSVHAFKS